MGDDDGSTRDGDRLPSEALRRRWSRRISGIGAGDGADGEMRTGGGGERGAEAPVAKVGNEIADVALEVIAAHLSHLERAERAISREKRLLSELGTRLDVSILDGTKNGAELAERLASLTEEQVCDYFESVHVCVDEQRIAGEALLKEMERISRGDHCGANDHGSGGRPPRSSRRELAQSPMILGGPFATKSNGGMGDARLDTLQKDLKDIFASTPSKDDAAMYKSLGLML